MVKITKTKSGKNWKIVFDGINSNGMLIQGAYTGTVYMRNLEMESVTADDMPTTILMCAKDFIKAKVRGWDRNMLGYDVRAIGARVVNASVIH